MRIDQDARDQDELDDREGQDDEAARQDDESRLVALAGHVARSWNAG
jgi:hypothetical protein